MFNHTGSRMLAVVAHAGTPVFIDVSTGERVDLSAAAQIVADWVKAAVLPMAKEQRIAAPSPQEMLTLTGLQMQRMVQQAA